MTEYKKAFDKWAKVAKEIETRRRRDSIKVGAVYWMNVGVGIKTELLGKGNNFTRPCLILTKLTDDLVFVIPTTSQPKTGSNYEPIVIQGKTEYLVLTQATPFSRLRIRGYIEEIPEVIFNELQKRYLRFIRYQLYKKDNLG